MDIVAIISFLLDQPALQEPGAKFVAALLKSKLPAAIDKDVGDFLARVARELGATPPTPPVQ